VKDLVLDDDEPKSEKGEGEAEGGAVERREEEEREEEDEEEGEEPICKHIPNFSREKLASISDKSLQKAIENYEELQSRMEPNMGAILQYRYVQPCIHTR